MSFKSGFVSIIGRTNVGKSTLLNSIIKEKVAITSNRPQTTRNTIRGIFNDEDSQIVFIDTPGIHKPKNRLGKYMIKSASNSIANVDVVLFVVDATVSEISEGDLKILNELKSIKEPVILVINKIDKLPKNKESLLKFILKFNEYKKDDNSALFNSIIPISAINNDGVSELILELKKCLNVGPKYFPDDMYTDQAEKVMVAEIIRKQALVLLEDEVPHGIAVEVNQMKERQNGDIYIASDLICEREAHKPIIIGKKGQMLKQIGEKSRIEIEEFLGTKVYIDIWVKVKKNWQENDTMLKNLFTDFNEVLENKK